MFPPRVLLRASSVFSVGIEVRKMALLDMSEEMDLVECRLGVFRCGLYDFHRDVGVPSVRRSRHGIRFVRFIGGTTSRYRSRDRLRFGISRAISRDCLRIRRWTFHRREKGTGQDSVMRGFDGSRRERNQVPGGRGKVGGRSGGGNPMHCIASHCVVSASRRRRRRRRRRRGVQCGVARAGHDGRETENRVAERER